MSAQRWAPGLRAPGEIGRLGALLTIQRAVEEEVDAFLGRTRDEGTPEVRCWRNGNRPRRAQTAEGELEIQMPQIWGAAEKSWGADHSRLPISSR